MTHKIITVVLALTFVFAGGCSGEDSDSGSGSGSGTSTPAADVVNAKCPISGEDVDKSVTVDFNGKKVAFCCSDCVDAWKDLDPVAQAAKLAK